jgi:hypothetical protein
MSGGIINSKWVIMTQMSGITITRQKKKKAYKSRIHGAFALGASKNTPKAKISVICILTIQFGKLW